MNDLPRIVRFLATDDAPGSSCPHCGASGRYILRFTVDDGRTLGAMRGCVKLFPVSPVALEELRLRQKEADYAKKGWTLNRHDSAALVAIEAFFAGETLRVFRPRFNPLRQTSQPIPLSKVKAMHYMIQVRGEWAGHIGDRWRPAISGTLNQTGRTDAIASTFATREDADAAFSPSHVGGQRGFSDRTRGARRLRNLIVS